MPCGEESSARDEGATVLGCRAAGGRTCCGEVVVEEVSEEMEKADAEREKWPLMLMGAPLARPAAETVMGARGSGAVDGDNSRPSHASTSRRRLSCGSRPSVLSSSNRAAVWTSSEGSTEWRARRERDGAHLFGRRAASETATCCTSLAQA